MPQLTAEDIKRAMKNRKKIWHNLPEEGDDPFAFDPDETNDAVTRPIRRPSAFQNSRPVSVPLELRNPTSAAEEQEPAMEAPTPQASVQDQPAEMSSMIVNDEVPELASLFANDEPEETAPAMGEETAPSMDQETAPAMDQVTAPAMDQVTAPAMDQETAPALDEETVPAIYSDEPAEALSIVVDDGPMEVVVDDDEDEAVAVWPREAAEAPEPMMATPEAHYTLEPAQPEADSPNIQAMMARAALEAAGNTAAIDAVVSDDGEAKPARRAGRVKTRLLGFQADEAEKNIFDTSAAAKASEPDMFPVGWLVVVEGPGRGASFCLHNGVSLIGRGDDQAVRLDFGDTSISRDNHASIAFDDESGQFFLGHGGKSNIVRLNSKPVLSTEDLAHGDQIRIGETKLRFQAFCNADFSWTEKTEDGTGNAAVG